MSTAPALDGEWNEPPALHPLLPRRLRLVPPPSPLTPLLGRSAEVATVSALLASGQTRLITLIGPGGIGKTRLALGIAAHLAGMFDGQVAWSPMVTSTTPAMVAAELTRAIGLPDTGTTSPFVDLEAALRDQRLLLIIDNFEQALVAAPFLSDLLHACPGLSLLVTSRALLRIAGEHPIDVPPLATEPDPSDVTIPPAVAPAVQLFAQRAASVSPSFTLTPANTPVVADICRRLDGLPLAIELASERSLLLSPTELLARLDRRLPHLTAGRRDGPARHRTMRDAIAWSYDLLSPTEQTVLRSLSVFAGGCTLAAAEAVCLEPAPADGAATGGTVPASSGLLESLIAQSLVRVAPAVDGETPRLVMLQAIHEFAAECLAASGDARPHHRHAEYFRDLAVHADRELLMGDFRTWNTLLAPERANLRVAVEWALQEREVDIALQLVMTMYSAAWVSRSFFQEKEAYLRRALALPGGSPTARVEALAMATWTTSAHFDQDQLETIVEEAFASAGQTGDALALPRLHAAMGMLAVRSGDEQRARSHFSQAADGFRRVSATVGLAWAQCELATMDSRDAEDEGGGADALALARDRYDEAARLFRAADYPHGIASALHGLAYVTYKQRDLPLALGNAQECLARAWALRAPVFAFLEDIADIAGLIGQRTTAARLYGAAEIERERFAQPLEPQYRAENERDAAAARHANDEEAFAADWSAGRSLTEEQAVAVALAVSMQPDESAHDGDLPTKPASLSPRELEVMRLLAAGLSDRDIAERLFIGERTVNSHVAHVFVKLGVHNRAAAVTAAVSAGMVDPALVGMEPA